MKVGDQVEWTSQSGGYTRTKQGTIVEVVPPLATPKTKTRDMGMYRPKESYIVVASVIDGSENQRKTKKKYWPRARQLRLLQEKKTEETQ